jgi:hypothetical protein
MESTDRPARPLVSGALLVGWAEWADSVTFSKASWRRRGYLPIEVDAFREEIRDTFLGATRSPVKSEDVRGTQFSSTTYFTHDEPNNRYDKNQVDAFLDAAGIRLAAMESTDRPDGPLVSGAILARWAEWADSTRFSTSRVRVGRYDTAEVDAFRGGYSRHVPRGKRTPSDVACAPRQAVHDYPPTTTWLRPGAG